MEGRSFNGRGGGRGRGGGGFAGRGRDGENDDEKSFTDDKPKEFYIPPDPSTNEAEIFNTGIESGINFQKYDKIPVKVTGDDIPPPVMSFKTSGLSDFLLQNIEKCGYKDPTPIQKTAIPIVQAKRDLMACAQTGSGKTAAFILPILNALLTDPTDMKVGKPQVVIISPTRELTIQVICFVKQPLDDFIFFLIEHNIVPDIHRGTEIRIQQLPENGCYLWWHRYAISKWLDICKIVPDEISAKLN